MKKLLILTILTLTCSVTSFAQDKATDLKKLFSLMDTEKMIDGMMDNMVTVFKQQANEQFQGADASKTDKYFEFVVQETKVMSKKLVNEDMVNIYDKHFTQDEVKDLIKFFESSTGKKMLDKTPQITMDLMNVIMEKHMPEFQEKLEKKLEELK
ncbi:MAG: DUF2059 domain-containing protein [Saprospiraceae bacterium]|nr:DUF2059 domain-containing protein [Saprospiraceae bacterium]MBK8634192.1 DUF2059 domain-containing protein [Saprospiraceae bacterium]MBP7642696.1 DUF2059 domain-containing protein [Saprospiraceae bacterium]